METWDRQGVEWLSARDWPVVTPVMRGLTDAGNHGLVWIAIAAVVALWLRRPLILAGVVVAVEAASYVDGVLKSAIGRARPPFADPHVHALIPVPHDPSMPSGHAIMAFAGAVVLGALVPVLRWPLLALATGVALSRVYLGVHYPSDVIAGAALGAAIGLGAAWLVNRGDEMLAARRRPVAG
ncbi:MAG: phosphatase PAP2 family protein [Gaiellales bacterium]